MQIRNQILSSPKLIVFNSIKIIVIVCVIIFTIDSCFAKNVQKFILNHFYLSLFGIVGYWTLGALSFLLASYSPNMFIRITFTILTLTTTLSSLIYKRISGGDLNYQALKILYDNLFMADSVFFYYWTLMIVPFIFSVFTLFLLLPPPKWVKNYFSNSYRSYFFYILIFIPFTIFPIYTILLNHNKLCGSFVQHQLPSDLLKVIIEDTMFGDNDVRNSIDIVTFDTLKYVKPNTVLIVDESVRGDCFNTYAMDSTVMPFFYKNMYRGINYGLISSGANGSAFSNCILRFGPNPEHISQTYYSNSYIWQYAKKAGYKVVYIEGQMRSGYNNRMNKKEVKYIDDFIYTEGNSNRDVDDNIASTILKLLKMKSLSPIFIYAVKAGIHFPYEELVPKNKRIFPTNFNGSLPVSRQDMINSYKNSLNYCIDPFFKRLLNGSPFTNTVIFYTSDHGQNLLDNGLMITHASVRNTVCYEGVVPLLIFTNNTFFDEKFRKGAKINFDKASHFNIFPTLLDIWGFNKSEYRKFHGISLFDTITFPRKFLSGEPTFRSLKNINYNWNAIPDSVISH